MVERWRGVLGRDVQASPGGAITLALDSGSVRFVQAVDGRGDGVSGVDLRAREAASVLDAARRGGLQTEGDAVRICGTRLRLID